MNFLDYRERSLRNGHAYHLKYNRIHVQPQVETEECSESGRRFALQLLDGCGSQVPSNATRYEQNNNNNNVNNNENPAMTSDSIARWSTPRRPDPRGRAWDARFARRAFTCCRLRKRYDRQQLAGSNSHREPRLIVMTLASRMAIGQRERGNARHARQRESQFSAAT